MLKRIIGRLPERMRAPATRWCSPRFAYLWRQRVSPISTCYGMDRGQPVDRYFIERFLQENQSLVRGACLEVQDSAYTRRFGGDRVTRSDVLDIDASNARATIIGDLRRLDAVGDATYDCVIITQVLQYIDDVERAVREVTRIVKPGGAILATVPCLQRNERYPHHWKFTTSSAEYLFAKCLPREDFEVRGWGNVLAGQEIWVGMAVEDLPRRHLDHHDPMFPCTVSIRATKPFETAPPSPVSARSPAVMSVAV